MGLVAYIAVCVDVQETVFGQIDQIVPSALVSGRVTTVVGNSVVDDEGLPGQYVVWAGDAGHLKIGWRCQRDAQGRGQDIVAFVLELFDGVYIGFAQRGQTITNAAWILPYRKNSGVGFDDDVKLPADRLWDFER